MSEQINLIRTLLEYVEAYTKTGKKTDIQAFTHFLNKTVLQENHIPGRNLNKEDYQRENFKNYKQYAEIEFSTLLTNLYRFAKHYIKKAFQNTDIRTIDEFGFLATLLKQEHIRKKDLINRHILETSSGSEILKRLYSKGLISQTTHEEDKRAKWVSLTEKGRLTIMNSFDEMHKVSEIIIGNLTDDEIEQSLKVFNKLSQFHHHIHEEDKNSDLTQIHQKHISGK